MKKFFVLFISLLLILTGCGKKAEVVVDELADSLVASELFCEKLERIDSRVAEKRYSFNTKDYTELAAYVGTKATADEFVIVTTETPEKVKGLLDEYLKNKIKVYEEYRPDEVYKLQNPYIIDYNECVVMIISHDSKTSEDAFNRYLKD